jgi:hypothetical protein
MKGILTATETPARKPRIARDRACNFMAGGERNDFGEGQCKECAQVRAVYDSNHKSREQAARI